MLSPARPALPTFLGFHKTVLQATTALRGASQPHPDPKVIVRDYAYSTMAAGPAHRSKSSPIACTLSQAARTVLRALGRTGPLRDEAKLSAASAHIALAFDQMHGQQRDEQVDCALRMHVAVHLEILLKLERALDTVLGRWRMDDKERCLLLKRMSAVHLWAERTLRKEWRLAQIQWREDFQQAQLVIEQATSYR